MFGSVSPEGNMLQAGDVDSRGARVPPAVNALLPCGQFKMRHGNAHIEMLHLDFSQDAVVKLVFFQVEAIAAFPVPDNPPGLAVFGGWGKAHRLQGVAVSAGSIFS